MINDYIEDEVFKSGNFTEKPLAKAEYENCIFSNCVFSTSNLSNFIFAECIFDHCDLSMAVLKNTTFRDVQFRNCKLLGLRFDECNSFLLSFLFEGCMINFSSFYKLKLKNIQFIDCKLEETEFTEADLTNANFIKCDLNKAVFDRTILEQADLRSSYNFSINPEKNKINKAKFSLLTIAGLLDKYNLTIE